LDYGVDFQRFNFQSAKVDLKNLHLLGKVAVNQDFSPIKKI
jgi:hypothetical protein